MKTLLCLFVALITASEMHAQTANKANIIVKSPNEILRSNDDFFQYIALDLDFLTRKYTSYDASGHKITKVNFLHQLTTGRYLFLQTSNDSTKLRFKLYPLNAKRQVKYGQIIADYTVDMYINEGWVGKKFPAFDFIDINGKHYNNANMLGKIVVLKSWFIGCPECQKEMPALNKMVAGYKNHNDMVFISIAPDNASQLRSFFKTHPFDYVKIPDQANFIKNKLKVRSAPTHFVINKQGVVVSVVNDPQKLEQSLKDDI